MIRVVQQVGQQLRYSTGYRKIVEMIHDGEIGDIGFVGTTNFDYRSRLYNNEMGFLFESKALADEIRANTEYLIGTSYLWGSPEWLEMRRKVMESDSDKAGPARKQRGIYKTLRALGLEYLM